MNITCKKIMFSSAFLICLVFLTWTSCINQTECVQKPRVIVLTDISFSEPDDAQSMIRLLLYSNVMEIEGLIATSAVFRHRKGDPVAPDMIRSTIDLYGKVRNNLLVHEQGFPTKEELLKVVKKGSPHSEGLSQIGDGKSSPGSNHIIEVLEEPDERPVYILVWGGATTLAQAIYDLGKKHPKDNFDNLLEKIIVYEIGGQDEAGAWVCHEYSKIKWLRSKDQWNAISKRQTRWEKEALIGDTTVMVSDWFVNNIQNNHGVLGNAFPTAKHRWEGDTPSFLYVISGAKGLSDPEQWTQGGWGGRFGASKIKNYYCTFKRIIDETPYHDFYTYPDVSDKWEYNGQVFNNIYVPLVRWRTDFQKDFAARMDWSTTADYSKANHNPVAVVNQNNQPVVMQITGNPGEKLLLDATSSSDPDGDMIKFHWFRYAEADSYSGEMKISDSSSGKTNVIVPNDLGENDIHIILRITDNGTPELCGYKRIIITKKK